MENSLNDAFRFNLECYDNNIIDKEDFINAMEENIAYHSNQKLKAEIDTYIERIKADIRDDFADDTILPKSWDELSSKCEPTEYYADYITDFGFSVANVITDKLDDWLKEEWIQIKTTNKWHK
tara:strand:+ start:2289 stop:2657 length:369 start_codon:yes stop_codon:yes gene_type:complete